MKPMTCTSPDHAPRGSWRGVIVGLVTGAMLVIGCGKNAPSTEAPGDAGAADSPGAEPDSETNRDGELAELELELDAYEDAMLASGFELPEPVAATRADRGRTSVAAASGGSSQAGPRCERICGLANSICGLRERICELADEHGPEPRYARACERATLDCERATEACVGCKE